jgi:pyridoxine kinase
MADNGKLYVGFSDSHVAAMSRLCAKADIVLPNITEACLMLGLEYRACDYGKDYIRTILDGLLKLGAKVPIVTGVSYSPGEVGIVGFDSASGREFSYFHEKIDHLFHGTGDVFASAFTGALMKTLPLEQCIKIAADFTVASIKNTLDLPRDRWYGVRFEDCLGLLCMR